MVEQCKDIAVCVCLPVCVRARARVCVCVCVCVSFLLFQAGVPRMAYKGVVSFLSSGQRVYLAPSKPWVGYVDK